MDGLNEVLARVQTLDVQLRQLRPASAQAPAPTSVRQDSFAEMLRTIQPAPERAAPVRAFGVGAGTLTPGGVPTDLQGYGNGRIPADALSPLGGGQSLWSPAAESFQRMERAAAAAGVRLGVNDSYRSLAEQQDLVARKGLYSQGGLAAAPGTSDHGWGRSLDLQLDTRGQAWMRQNAGAYGFAENVAREPWHWTYSP